MMMKILVFCFIQSVFCVELSIYRSFTEVRQEVNGVGEYRYDFTNDDYGNIIDGSITWEGTPFVREELFNRIQSLENAQVIVRRSSSGCGCDTIQAKIIDPSSMLLQNSKTGSYFYADKQSIEYLSNKPNNDGTTFAVTFENERTKHNGTVSYLIKGLTWKPNYDLILSDNNEVKLRAYANIQNNQQREYTVEKTHLLGGDVQLAHLESPRRFDSAKSSSMARPISVDGEQKGLYSYSLKDQYTLRPSSSVRLPFIDILLKYQFYYKVLTNIATVMYEGVFERNYDITPDQYMPAGIITVRDDQLLVGQANLPDIPKNYTQTFSVGQDNDVRYLVKGNMTGKSNDNATLLWETYQLDVQISNLKNKNVNAQLALQGGLQIDLLNTTCSSIQIQGNQLNLLLKLEQGETRQCKVLLTLRLN